jgi:glutamine synthetase
MEALHTFQADDVIKAELGPAFHHYFHSLKQFEVNRFLSAVTDWEHTEYFEIF